LNVKHQTGPERPARKPSTQPRVKPHGHINPSPRRPRRRDPLTGVSTSSCTGF
jgi:hypothetical protein